MTGPGFLIPIVFRIGPLAITQTVVVTWLLMLALVTFSWLATRRLRVTPGPLQVAVEGAVTAMGEAVHSVLPEQAPQVLPFIATLWIFITAANLAGLIPGLASPTADLSTTTALAVLVFLSVHWFGIRSSGLKAYLHHYLQPSAFLFPFQIISEITRSVALAVRLFGNMMSLDMAALLVLLVAGFLVPVPILMLHVIEALVQAYIFGMLALIYIAGAIQSRETTKNS